MQYNQYRLVDVYGREADHSKVINYWVSNNLLSMSEAQKRVSEVILIIFYAECIVGVITAASFFKDRKKYFYGRISIAKKHRGTRLFFIAWKFILEKLSHRKNSGEINQCGLVVELSNPKLTSLAVKKRVLQPLKAVPLGLSKNRMQVWLYEF
ncbi:hypothetical protein [Pseudoalteromonas sp. SCSIO 43101]|uniref:hypothetical protein n=1 Tax=Pseudoalteromonas sp. SCSIO 43101 TaxID=2822847 RepID=UPI00202AEFC0|nr:hypothetical protein [Pseudoalteromonas sp. SCSIO 43101]URQ92797.1 hypothetical protein J8Z25_18750 [Pseudoalteromonas sp. SCSIO 43101]